MNRGAFHGSLLPQTMVGSQPWWGTTDLRPISSDEASPPLLQPPPPSFSAFPLFLRPANSLSLNSLYESQELPPSWSQLLLGGIVSEEVRYDLGSEEIQAATGNRPTWNQLLPQVSPPKSCVTSPSLSSSVLDFSNNSSETRHMITPDHSPECNSVETGVAVKKARVQSSSSSQSSAFKARKEKLGDRITALHQLVSPFGKTDTASVLLEAIGYIRFLQNQIEALSSPYLVNGSGNMRHPVQREGSRIFPEDPGQLLNDNCLKTRGRSPVEQVGTEETKDLRSRGLCLVPVSCTLHVGSDNGADYWAASIGGKLRYAN